MVLDILRRLAIGIAHAQQEGAPESIAIPGSCDFAHGFFGQPGQGFICIRDYIVVVTDVVIGFSATFCLIMLIVNGFRYMLGPVTDGSSDAAKKGITYALVGLAVSLLAYLILDTIIMSITT